MATLPITARDTKASLESLISELNIAKRYSSGYYGAPMYVQRTTQHIYLKINDLEREARRLLDKCPDKFRFEP